LFILIPPVMRGDFFTLAILPGLLRLFPHNKFPDKLFFS
jgi:hypothetical protein